MKGMSFGEGTGYKSPQMMKKEAAMKMKKNSPTNKSLAGDQNAPTKLTSAITRGVGKLSRDAAEKYKKEQQRKRRSREKAGDAGATAGSLGKLLGRKSNKAEETQPVQSPNKIAKGATEDSLGGVIKRRRTEQGKRVKAKRRSNSSDPFKITNIVAGMMEAGRNIQNKTLQKKMLQDNPPGSAGRKAVYDRLGWKYDDTVPGYNRDGTKVSDTKKSTMTDPKKTDITGDKDYTTASTKGRKTTVVKTEGDKTATLVDTKRNIGDKRVVNITGPKGDMRDKTKFDTAGDQTKKKRKITLPDGTVVKIKSKRGGKRKVKIRKKGQIFGKRDRAREARLNEDLSMQPKN